MTSKQPNVIMLVLDTQRADHMSLYGYNKDTTPILSEFAENSTIFDWAISTAPWTIPSHSSMFTGLYPTVHQTNQSFNTLPSDIPTLAELLSQNGYDTIGFCNNPLVSVLDNGLKRGFDEFYNYSGTFPDTPDFGDISTARKIHKATSEVIQKATAPAIRKFGNSGLLLKLAMMPIVVPIWTRLGRFKGDTKQSIQDVTDYLRYRHNSKSGQPFFAFINMMETHLPYYPPRKVMEKWVPYLKRERDMRAFVQRFNTESYRWVAPMIEPFSRDEEQVLRDVYDAEIAYQDTQLRKLFRYLKRSNMLDDTMVIVVSDHGESHGDHDFMGHAFVNYNEITRVPMFIHYPEMFPAGHHVEHNVSTRRIFHTILDVAGIQHEAFGFNAHDLSFARSAEGISSEREDEVVISEAFPVQNFLNVMEVNSPGEIERFRVDQMRRAYLDNQYKLMTVSGEVDELFDIYADPFEERNLIDGTPVHSARILQMHQKLESFVEVMDTHRIGTSGAGDIDYSDNPELIERLRGLGYIE